MPCPIKLEGVPEKDQVKLGVPLGSKDFTCDYVKDDLLTRLKPVLERLEAFEDTQAAIYLLRVSFSIVRATHYMRTTPLDQWKEHAVSFDNNLKKSVENILAVKMTAPVRKQSSLTPKLGGLGFRRTVDHANFAYTASWHEALSTAQEQWDRPDGVPEEYKPQSVASFEFDQAVHTELVLEMETAGKLREAQRLQCLAQPHAGGFVTALPSRHDGHDTIIKPRTFRTAIYYRMGIPILDQETSCPLCMQTINIYGDHATCCSKSGDLIVRHNALRNLVERIARDGLLSPELEKKGILGSAPGRRPGDVTIAQWEEDRALALDIAVTSPLNDTNIRTSRSMPRTASTTSTTRTSRRARLTSSAQSCGRRSVQSTARERTICARSCALPPCARTTSTALTAAACGPASLAASSAK